MKTHDMHQFDYERLTKQQIVNILLIINKQIVTSIAYYNLIDLILSLSTRFKNYNVGDFYNTDLSEIEDNSELLVDIVAEFAEGFVNYFNFGSMTVLNNDFFFKLPENMIVNYDDEVKKEIENIVNDKNNDVEEKDYSVFSEFIDTLDLSEL